MSANPFDDLVPQQGGQPAAPQGADPTMMQAPPAEQGPTPVEQQQAPAQQAQAPNPFDDLVPGPKEKAQSAFMDGVENFNRQFGRMAEGVMDLTFRGAEALGSTKAAQLRQMNALNSKMLDDSAAAAEARSPNTALAAKMLGGVGSAVAYGGALGMGGSLPAAMAKTGLISGMQSAAEMAPDMETRGQKGLIGGTIGAVMPAVGAAIGAGYNALKGGGSSGYIKRVLDPNTAAADDLALGVTPEEGILAQGRVKAANNIGMELSPAQATGSELLKSQESSIPATLGAKAKAASYLNKQEAILKPQAQKLVDEFTPEGQNIAADLQATYKDNLKKFVIPAETKVLTNPSVVARLKAVSNNVDLAAKDLPDNNLAKLDAVKQEIDRDLWANTNALRDKPANLTGGERSQLLAARKELMEAMDAVPDTGYQQSRKIAQQYIYKRTFEDALKKSGDGDTSQGMYKVLWNTQEKKEYFLDAVKETGGNVKHAKEIIDLMEAYKNTGLDKLVKKQVQSVKPTQIVGRLDAGYQDALLKLMLSPSKQWQSAVAAGLNTPTPGAKFENVGRIVAKIMEIGGNVATAKAGAGWLSSAPPVPAR